MNEETKSPLEKAPLYRFLKVMYITGFVLAWGVLAIYFLTGSSDFQDDIKNFERSFISCDEGKLMFSELNYTYNKYSTRFEPDDAIKIVEECTLPDPAPTETNPFYVDTNTVAWEYGHMNKYPVYYAIDTVINWQHIREVFGIAIGISIFLVLLKKALMYIIYNK